MAVGLGFVFMGMTGDLSSMPAGRAPVVLAGAAFFFVGLSIFVAIVLPGKAARVAGYLIATMVLTTLLGVPAVLFLGTLGVAAVVFIFTASLTAMVWTATRRRLWLIVGIAGMLVATTTTWWLTRPPYTGPVEAPVVDR